MDCVFSYLQGLNPGKAIAEVKKMMSQYKKDQVASATA